MPAISTRIDGDRAYELKDGVWYLIEDEENMGQGDPHAQMVLAMFQILKQLLSPRPLARVFHDIYIHWDPAKGGLCVAPDLTVFPQVQPRERRAVYLWEELSRPVFVLEVLSRKTRLNDWGKKMETYRDDLQVPEYFICEPSGEKQKVWGHRLIGGEYRQIKPVERGRVWSEELGAWFGADESGELRVWDAAGRLLRQPAEMLAERDEARTEREAERQRAEAALVEREAERQRAEAAEARVGELEAALRRLNGNLESPAE